MHIFFTKIINPRGIIGGRDAAKCWKKKSSKARKFLSLLMLRYSGTMCIKHYLFKITKCFAHHNYSYLCIYNFSKKSCSDLKSTIKIPFNLWSFDRSIIITEIFFKFEVYTLYKIEAKLIIQIKISSLFAFSKHCF